MTKFLTAEELSRLLRIPKRSIYKFAKDGQIPGTLRIGKHWRFRTDTIEKWLLDQTADKISQTDGHKMIFDTDD